MACAAPSEGIFDDVHLDHPISLGWYGGDIRGSRVVHVWFTCGSRLSRRRHLSWAGPSDGVCDDVHLDHPISLGWYGGDIRGSCVVHVWFTCGSCVVHVWFTFEQEAPPGMG